MFFKIFSSEEPKNDEQTVKEMPVVESMPPLPPAPEDDDLISREMQERMENLDKIKTSLADFESAINQARSSSSLSESRLSGIQNLLRVAESDVDRQFKLERENSELREEVDDLRAKLQQSREKSENKKLLIDSLKDRAKETREALQQAHVDITQHLRRREALRSQVEEYRSKLNQQEFELKALNEHNKQLEEENERVRMSGQNDTARLSDLEQALGEMERRSTELKRLHELEVARREQMSSENKEFKGRLHEMTREKIDLETRLELAVNDLASRSRHLKEQARAKDDRIYALESKVEAMASQIKVNEHTITTLREENRERVKHLANEEERVRSLKEQLTEMKAAHNEDREKLFSSVNRISELELRIANLVEERELAVGESTAFSQIVDKLTSENKQLSEKIIALGTIEEKYNKLLLEHESAKSDSEEFDDDGKVVKIGSKKKKSA